MHSCRSARKNKETLHQKNKKMSSFKLKNAI